MEEKIKKIQQLAAKWEADQASNEASAVLNKGACQAAKLILSILNEQQSNPPSPAQETPAN